MIIVSAWDKHFELYAETKASLEDIKHTYRTMALQMQELRVRLARNRAKARTKPPAERAEIERELASIEFDMSKNEVKMAQNRQKIKALEKKLEATWDIW